MLEAGRRAFSWENVQPWHFIVIEQPEMKEKLYKAGFQIRPKGAKDAWARVTKEIDIFRDIINQAGIQKL